MGTHTNILTTPGVMGSNGCLRLVTVLTSVRTTSFSWVSARVESFQEHHPACTCSNRVATARSPLIVPRHRRGSQFGERRCLFHASRRGKRVQVLTSSAATPLMSSQVWPGV